MPHPTDQSFFAQPITGEKPATKEKVSSADQIATYYLNHQRLNQPLITVADGKTDKSKMISMLEFLETSPEPLYKQIFEKYTSLFSVDLLRREIPQDVEQTNLPQSLDDIDEEVETKPVEKKVSSTDKIEKPKDIDAAKSHLDKLAIKYKRIITAISGDGNIISTLEKSKKKAKTLRQDAEVKRLTTIRDLFEILQNQFEAMQDSSTPERLLLEMAKIDVLRDSSLVLPADRRLEFLKESEDNNRSSQNAAVLTPYLRGLVDKDINKHHRGENGLRILLSRFNEVFGADKEFLPVGKYGENLLNVIDKIKNNGVVTLLGPTGSGKTSLAEAAARVLGLDSIVYQLSASNYESPDEVKERLTITDGNSVLIPTEIGKRIRDGGMVILDEFTKLDPAKQGVYNQILGLKPGKRISIAGEVVTVHQNFKIVTTGNRSKDGNYAVHQLADDARNRLGSVIEVQYVHSYGYETGERGEMNKKLSLVVDTDESGKVTKLTEAGSSERISQFWKHEFTTVCLLRFADHKGEINMRKEKFQKLVQFIERLNIVHAELPLSLREIDNMVHEWQSDPKSDPSTFLKNLVLNKVENVQQATELNQKIDDANIFTGFEDQSENIKIPFSMLAGIIGVQDTLAPERDLVKEQEIKELKLQMDQLLAKVQEQFETGYCSTYFQQQKSKV